MKLFKKTFVVIIVLSILVSACAYSVFANTNTVTNTATNTVQQGTSVAPTGTSYSDFIWKNGVTFYSMPVYEGYPESEVRLFVENTDMNGGTLAGVEGQVFFEGAHPTGEISIYSEGWQAMVNVDNDNNCMNFVIEAADLTCITTKPYFAIKYILDDADAHIAYINKGTFKKTDLHNNVYSSLEGISDVPFDFGVDLTARVEEPIESRDSNTIRVVENNMLVKFEGFKYGADQNVVIDPIDLLKDDLIDINIPNWTSLTITTDDATATMEREDEDFILDNNRVLVTSGDNIKLTLTVPNSDGTDTVFEYNVIQMGNTLYANDSGSAINVKDVVALRQAVVGMESIFNDSRFHIEASDVNFSNPERGTLGDIGDIISIRQRILNYMWLDK